MELFLTNSTNSSLDIKSTSKERQNSEDILNIVYICVGSCFVGFGLISNFISFFVFLKASRRAPTIVTKNLLIMFTISNSLYLMIFWYYSNNKIFLKILLENFFWN
jgi:hypothetical protein